MNVSPRAFRRLWPEFDAPSWAGWASVEDAILGEPPDDPELVARLTGGRPLPSSPVSEAWVVAGRGAGKSRWAARLACLFAAGRTYSRRAPGERIYCGIFAPDRKQAIVTFRYVLGLLKAVPVIERTIERELRESVELDNGYTVEVITASKAAPRGRSYALVVIEEAAYLPVADSAEPDVELLRALRPALARVPGSLLVVVSSPYARRGAVWQAHREHFGKPSPHVLVVQGSTATLNPSFDAREIERAYSADPIAAAAEYGAQFRSDVETFVRREAVEACVVPGRHELPPTAGMTYSAFVDPSGGGADAFCLAIGHSESRDGRPLAIVDAIRERRPPFSPEAVVEDFSALLATYRVSRVLGDKYAGEWPRESFRRHGITYEPAAKPKSDIYRDALAILNAARLELPDNERLTAQLLGLERRTARGGRDSIDHAPGGHDDMANVALGLACGLTVQAGAPMGFLLDDSERSASGCAWSHEVFDRASALNPGREHSLAEAVRIVARARRTEAKPEPERDWTPLPAVHAGLLLVDARLARDVLREVARQDGRVRVRDGAVEIAGDLPAHLTRALAGLGAPAVSDALVELELRRNAPRVRTASPWDREVSGRW